MRIRVAFSLLVVVTTGLSIPRYTINNTTASTNNTVSISLPASAPSSAQTIDPNFIAFGFEEASFVPFVLDNNGNTNTFSANLISEITKRTGGQPIIRLGGTSADYGTYLANQSEPVLPTAGMDHDDDVGGTTIGPSFWKLTSRFPDAAYMIQVPLATTDANETVQWVQSAIDNIASDQIFSIEIGNEPDWYSSTYTGTGGIVLGPPDWQGKFTNETYVGNYTARADAIVAGVTGLPSQPIFQAFDTAAHVNDVSAVLAYEMAYDVCFPLGIDDKGYIKTAANHYYQNEAGTAATLASGLMDLSFTHTRMDYFSVRIDYLKQNRPDVPFVLSEVGNSLGAVLEYQARLGSALWLVDFYLYAIYLGVQRVHYQQMVSNGYLPNLWLPVESAGYEPVVYANYYAPLLVADFIGSSGTTSMTKVNASGGDVSDLAAYVAFEDGKAQRVAVVNMQYWNLTSSGTSRPTVGINLSVPSGVKSASVAHLSSSYGAGADASTITYDGSQWTYESLGEEATSVEDNTETVTAVHQVVSFNLNASEAVLVTLEYS